MSHHLSFLKKLTLTQKSSGGRNQQGRITVKGLKIKKIKYIRLLNFYYLPINVPGIVLGFGTSIIVKQFFTIVLFKNGLFSYLPRTSGLVMGDFIDFSKTNNLFYGCGRLLKYCNFGFIIHHLCNKNTHKSTIIRAKGSTGKILYHYRSEKKRKLNGFSLIKLPSGEQKLINSNTFCTLGFSYGFTEKKNKFLKASDSLVLKGRRSQVRGVAMNPVDHPHGGGEGKTSGGRPSVSPWGWLTKGPKTRKNYSSQKNLRRRTRQHFKLF